ncbi:hypothetical protein PLICRDRAFT_29720 [Plicaturopsis crispa FD-325 SS-3]|nr:hypothetical protein PLICRDRAFT_29720 [Plicaturopsis crispa FD-325 SS-3]
MTEELQNGIHRSPVPVPETSLTTSQNQTCTPKAIMEPETHKRMYMARLRRVASGPASLHGLRFIHGIAFHIRRDEPSKEMVQTCNSIGCGCHVTAGGQPTATLPPIWIERRFQDLPSHGCQVHDMIVGSGDNRLLISGYTHPDCDINIALSRIAPGLQWRGEIFVLSVGRRVPVHKTVRQTRRKITNAINVYLAAVLASRNMGAKPPTHVE